MKRKLLGRGILILTVVLAAIALAYPPKDKINLGLDLQGGMHLVLQVHTQEALRATVDNDIDRLPRLAKNTALLEFRLTRVPKSGGNGLTTRQAVVDALGGHLPPDVEILDGDVRDEHQNVVGKQYWAVDKHRVMTGRELKDARLGQGQFQEPVV